MTALCPQLPLELAMRDRAWAELDPTPRLLGGPVWKGQPGMWDAPEGSGRDPDNSQMPGDMEDRASLSPWVRDKAGRGQ